MQEYLGICYFRAYGQSFDTINIFLTAEIADRCILISQWRKSNVNTLYYKHIDHSCGYDCVFSLINEYKRLEYQVDSEKYKEASREFEKISF